MTKRLSDKFCVRTRIKNHFGEFVNQGSGVIVKDEGSYYVITAYHCIYGEEKDEPIEIATKDIYVEYQENFDSDFQRLKVNSVVSFNKEQDWALLKIFAPTDMNLEYSNVQNGKNFIDDEIVHFSGYGNKNSNEFRPFKATILNCSDTQFKITLDGDSFSQGSEDGASIAKGLSGCGVFIERTEQVYLIGILKSVIGEIALYDDIMCCPISCLGDNLTTPLIDIGKVAMSGVWEEKTEKYCTEKDIIRWRANNDDYFKNLIRKNEVLYPNKDKAQNITRKRILNYLEQEYIIKQILNKGGALIADYQKTSELFEESVRDDYTGTVENHREARNLLLRLEQDFSTHIKDLFNDKSGHKNLKFSKHKVTWWLMNCSLKFED